MLKQLWRKRARRAGKATDFTYRPQVYMKAWARDIRNNYGNMKDFRPG